MVFNLVLLCLALASLRAINNYSELQLHKDVVQGRLKKVEEEIAALDRVSALNPAVPSATLRELERQRDELIEDRRNALIAIRPRVLPFLLGVFTLMCCALAWYLRGYVLHLEGKELFIGLGQALVIFAVACGAVVLLLRRFCA